MQLTATTEWNCHLKKKTLPAALRARKLAALENDTLNTPKVRHERMAYAFSKQRNFNKPRNKQAIDIFDSVYHRKWQGQVARKASMNHTPPAELMMRYLVIESTQAPQCSHTPVQQEC